MYMTFNKYCMLLIASIHFDASPFSRLPNNSGIETMNGHFCIYSIDPTNYDYEGEMPDQSYFGAQSMKAELYINRYTVVWRIQVKR